MILQQLINPKNKNKENLVSLTMTLDQYRMLRDCVTLAFTEAKKDSRMFIISKTIYNDINNLKLDCE